MSRRAVLRIARIVAVLGAVVFAGAWAITCTGWGTRIALGILRNRLGPAITIETIEGTLSGPLEIRGIRYQGEQASVAVDSVRLDWRLSRLLLRELDVELLEVSGVTVVLRTSPGEDTIKAPARDGKQPAPDDFRLPVNLRMPRGVVYRLAVNRFVDSTITALDSLTVAVVTRRDSVAVEQVRIHGPDLWAGFEGAVRTSGAYPMSFEYAWNLIARGIPVAGRGRLSGDLERLDLWQETSEPARSEVIAEFDSVLTALTFTTSVVVADFNMSDIDSNMVAATVGGVLRARGTLSEFTGNAQLRVEHASVGVVTPRLSITRSGETFQLDSLEISFGNMPALLTGSGTIKVSEQQPTFDGVLGWTRLGWPFLEPPMVTSEGSARAAGTLDEFTLDAEARFVGDRVAPGSIVATGTGSRDSLLLSGTGEGFGGRFHLDGSARLRPQLGWIAAMEVDTVDLTALLPDTNSTLRSLSVAVRTEGTKIDGGLTGNMQVTRLSGVLNSAPFFGSAGAQLVSDGLRLDSARVALLDGEVRAEGTISWQPRLEWRILAKATDVNPGPLMHDSTDWVGALSAAVSIDGSRSPDGIRIEVDTVSGVLRGRTLSATGMLAIVDSTYTVDSLALEWGTMDMRASGEFGRTVNGRAEFHAPDLSVAVPNARGSLRADVSIGGSRSAPRFSGSFEASRLSYSDYAIEKLTGAGGFDFGTNGKFDFALDGSGLILRDRTVDTLGVSVAGIREDHGIAAFLAAHGSSAKLAAGGGVSTSSWIGNLLSLEFTDSIAGTWSLRESTDVVAGRDSVVVADPICMVSASAGVCGSGYWRSIGTWGFAAKASAIPLQRLRALFPQSLDVSGTIEGDAEFHAAPDGAFDGGARFETGHGEIHYSTSGNAHTLTHDSGSLAIEVGAEGVRSSMRIILESAGSNASTFAEVNGKLDLPRFRPLTDSLMPQQLDGRLRMSVSDLSAAEALYPHLVSIGGSLSADFTIGGTVREPRILGGQCYETAGQTSPHSVWSYGTRSGRRWGKDRRASA